MIKQKFPKYFYRFLICTSIIFAGCSVKTDTDDSNSRAKNGTKAKQTSSFSTSTIFLDGDPSGGELEIFVFNTTVRIRTLPTDSINKVAEKIVDSINTNVYLQKQAIKGKTDGSKLILTNVREYDLWMYTTDSGINIPEKPIDLLCSVESDDHLVVFRWKNPEAGYDRIHIVERGIPIAEGLAGTITSFKYDYLSPHGHVYDGKHVYRVVGVKRGTPSCPGICEVFLKVP